MDSVKSAGAIVQLEAPLPDISTVVWRRVLVSESVPLREPHDVVHLAMDGEGVHLCEFAVHGV